MRAARVVRVAAARVPVRVVVKEAVMQVEATRAKVGMARAKVVGRAVTAVEKAMAAPLVSLEEEAMALGGPTRAGPTVLR